VRSNIEVHVNLERYEEAIAGGALAFFGDKYAETVRVVGICEPEADRCFSKELCGGTHCHASGEVGAIVIVSETSIGAGMRRIEAVTGRAAAERIRRNEDALAGIGAMLRAQPGEIGARIEALQEEADALRRKVQALERAAARAEAQATSGVHGNQVAPTGDVTVRVLPAGVREIGDTKAVIRRAEAPSLEFLRDLADGYKEALGSAVILLGANVDGKPALLAMCTADVASRLPAVELVRVASKVVGGGGGGRPELAQGGGTDLSKLDEALAAAAKLAEERLRA
jgi:alanyl-tRNA synthetase